MSDKVEYRTITSSMYIVYGFLSSLILTEFLKASSSAFSKRKDVATAALVLGAAFWLFYMVFDTLVWLLSSETVIEAPSGSMTRHARRESFLWLLCRCVEYASLVWLYDVVNILNDISDVTKAYEPLNSIAQYSFDAAVVYLAWTVWHLVYMLTIHYSESSEGKKMIETNWAAGRLFVTAIVLFLIGNLISAQAINSVFMAYVCVFLTLAISVGFSFLFNPRYYERHVGYFSR